MQFEVAKSTLLKAISNVNGAIEKKNTIPVLQNIKIDVIDKNNFLDNHQNNTSSIKKSVSLTATDMDIIITSSFDTEVIKSGSTTVPAQTFFDIIRKIPENSTIIISQEDSSSLIIKSGRSKYNIPCIDSTEFPEISEIDLDNEIEIDSQKMLKMIDRTKFAISNDETRYNLNGIFLQLVGGDADKSNEIRTVATDGHRLSLSFIETASNDSFGVIIPKKAVAEIRRVIEGQNKISISVSDVKIKIRTDDTIIISKLIDGEFPPYDRVIPKNNNQIAIIHKKTFIDSIERVSIVATDKHRSIKLSFSNNKLVLQANSSESGFAYEEIDIKYSGDNMDTGFNARYLADIINQIDKEELIMKFSDGMSPAIIEAESLSSLFVIMPIRV